MKKIFLLITFLSLNNYLIAQSKTEQLKTLSDILITDQNVEKSFESFLRSITTQAKIQIRDTAKLNLYLDSVRAMLTVESKAILLDQVPVVYDSLYTESELKELIKFYKSPAGQKFLTVEPLAVKQLEISLQKKLAESQMKYRRQLKELRASSTPILDSITQSQLKYGPLSDVAFLNFRFGESQISYSKKLVDLEKEGKIKIDSIPNGKAYTFKSGDLLRNGKWKMAARYANDSLHDLKLDLYHPENSKEKSTITVDHIKEELIKKYGPYSTLDTTSQPNGNGIFKYYWITGNVKVTLNSTRILKKDNIYIISVSFTDTRKEKFRGGKFN